MMPLMTWMRDSYFCIISSAVKYDLQTAQLDLSKESLDLNHALESLFSFEDTCLSHSSLFRDLNRPRGRPMNHLPLLEDLPLTLCRYPEES
jgi:hypothetical protein